MSKTDEWVENLITDEELSAKLPIGRSNFRTLRQDGSVYVDKTALVYRLAIKKQKFFLSRPRRFGKSLLLSTFASLFQYGLEDFRGLAIEKLWKDTTYDVVMLDFSKFKDVNDIAAFRTKFDEHLESQFGFVGFKKSVSSDMSVMAQLDVWLQSRPPSSLVLLIDEYDAPLSTHLNDRALFDEIRNLLSEFYLRIKGCEGCLRFFFMTGITKIENASIFSAFNPVVDISFDPQYGSILGYTEADLKTYFAPYLERACRLRQAKTTDELLDRLRAMYDGFCFDMKAETHVYVPWSVLMYLDSPTKGLLNYWYDSAGLPSVLLNFFKTYHLDTVDAYAAPRSLSFQKLWNTADLDTLHPDVLLVQTGYLTVQSTNGKVYKLGYPNQEMRESMANLFLELLVEDDEELGDAVRSLDTVLKEDGFDGMMNEINRIIGGLDYARWNFKTEASCRSALQLMLASTGMRVWTERHNAWGRSDLEFDFENEHWVLELKLARNGEAPSKLFAKAREQLRARHYGEADQSFAEVVPKALVFSEEERRFVVWG